MPITTYMTGEFRERDFADSNIGPVLRELRQVTGLDWRVEQYTIRRRKRFRWRTTILYSLYCGIGDTGEFQIINFYNEGTGSSINTEVSASLVVTFMYGMMGGYDAARRDGDMVSVRVEEREAGSARAPANAV